MMYDPTSANQNIDTTCIATPPTPLTTYGYSSANQNHQSTGMATPITSMSESSTFHRITMPAKTTTSSRQMTSEIHQNSSRSRPPTCCMHVHQPQNQACKPGELPALRKVKTPHNGTTSVSKSPLAKQEISSQFSSCFEGIGRFPGDPYRFPPKPDYQPATHASKKQGISKEVNEHADWVHSNIFVEKALEREPYYTHSTEETTTEFPGRVEHARHFPTHMEMCMDDHFTQTTEGTQQQYLQDISHAEFPSGMENTPSFPGKQFLQGKEGFTLPDMEKMPVFLGNQFLQGKEKNMDTGTFTSGSIILNRYPMLSTLTHPGRVPQNFQQLKMESSNVVALPCFNFNAEATPHMETSKNVHSQDSHSNKTDRLKKSKVQGNRLTRFSHHFNTDSTCDQKSLPRDLHNYWNDRETLSINLKMDTNIDTNHMTTIPMAHKEVYLLPKPLKAMAHQY